MTLPTVEELYEAGAHFGHRKAKAHPKAGSYVFMVRDGIQVIDLEKTIEGLEKALGFLKTASAEGKTFLFVGTKLQSREIIEKAAQNAESPYVATRWLGGMITNFETILKNLKKIEQMEQEKETEKYKQQKKSVRVRFEEKLKKLKTIFAGILNLKELPDILIIADAYQEKVAVEEAIVAGLTTVAIVDTNINPEKINYPIPGNDDAPKTVKLIFDLISETIKTNRPKIKKESAK